MDRLQVRRTFRKAWWICKCGQEDYTDLNVGTPSVYEHNCSVCGQWSNSFKEYNSTIDYPYDKYADVKEADVEKEKTARLDAWVYGVKNPVPYVEPTKAELEAERDMKLQEVASLDARISEAELEEGK